MRKIAWLVFLLLAVGLGIWLSIPPFNPREAVLGNWREKSTKLRVEVKEMQASWRGAGRGTVRYEWLQDRDEPYRIRITHGKRSVEANLVFLSHDECELDPQIWDQLPADAQRMLRDINHRNGRPDREFKLYFRREKNEQSSSQR